MMIASPNLALGLALGIYTYIIYVYICSETQYSVLEQEKSLLIILFNKFDLYSVLRGCDGSGIRIVS